MARYYRYVAVGGQAGAETIVAALTSTPEEPKRAVEVWVYESTPTRNNDAVLRVYVERERVAEVPIRMYLDQASTPTYPLGHGTIPLDITLDVGETLYVGHVSGTTASSTAWVIVYEIVGE